MEHGPHTTSRRRSLPPRISQISLRVWCTVAEAVSVVGISSSRKTGGSTTLVHFMRRSSMGWNMVYVGSVTLECHPERRAQTGSPASTGFVLAGVLERGVEGTLSSPTNFGLVAVPGGHIMILQQ